MASAALAPLRICDLSGQLAGAGATKILAAFGAQVIRIEDPATGGLWDLLRLAGPYTDARRGSNLGGAFNNHNVEKLGITLNLRSERGKDLFRELVRRSDVVTENFAAGVMQRLGFSYEELRALKRDIVYVSNCGFGHTGPYQHFKSWGPVVQAVCGLSFSSGLPGRPPAGWGFSFMDHGGACFMAIAILMAIYHRNRSGEGQWVDLACTEAGATLTGPAILDYTVNGRALRREGMPDSNRSPHSGMVPHGIYPARGDDEWIAIACRDDTDWLALRRMIDQPWADDPAYLHLAGRRAAEAQLDERMAEWTSLRDPRRLADLLQSSRVPAAAVARPGQRIDEDLSTREFGLWPRVRHTEIGEVRVDGLPLHLSRSDWEIAQGAPCVGEHNEKVYGEILGLSQEEIRTLRDQGTL